LGRLREGAGAVRLAELTADALERHLTALRDAGLSARSVNLSTSPGRSPLRSSDGLA
jgi:hypothetical protein